LLLVETQLLNLGKLHIGPRPPRLHQTGGRVLLLAEQQVPDFVRDGVAEYLPLRCLELLRQ